MYCHDDADGMLVVTSDASSGATERCSLDLLARIRPNALSMALKVCLT